MKGYTSRSLVAATAAVLVVLFFISPAVAEKRMEVLLPVARPHLIIEEGSNDEHLLRQLSQNAPTGRFKRVMLSVALDDAGENVEIPTDFTSAVAELRKMLPKDYLDFLLTRYGYLPSPRHVFDGRNLDYKFDDRILDLEHFLFDIWNLDDLSHSLAKEIDCMGNVEFDLTPIFVSLAEREALSTDGNLSADMDEATILLATLRGHCFTRHD